MKKNGPLFFSKQAPTEDNASKEEMPTSSIGSSGKGGVIELSIEETK